jgi:hypothetical protein
VWASKQGALISKNANFEGSKGLSLINARLLKQRGGLYAAPSKDVSGMQKSLAALPVIPASSVAQLLSQQGLANQGVQQAQQRLGQAVLALLAAIETQRQPDWSPTASKSRKIP